MDKYKHALCTIYEIYGRVQVYRFDVSKVIFKVLCTAHTPDMHTRKPTMNAQCKYSNSIEPIEPRTR